MRVGLGVYYPGQKDKVNAFLKRKKKDLGGMETVGTGETMC